MQKTPPICKTELGESFLVVCNLQVMKFDKQKRLRIINKIQSRIYCVGSNDLFKVRKQIPFSCFYCVKKYMRSFLFTSSDIHRLSVVTANTTSITLQWNESAPELTGNPYRNITQYAVTVTPRDGGEPRVVFVTAPAETAAVAIVTGLHLPNTFDIGIEVVINTEGQGEQTYDIGVPVITVTPGPGNCSNI